MAVNETGGLERLTPWVLWAKWSPVKKDPNTYHPLMCHLIDVAMVAEAMWREVLPEAFKRRLARAMGIDQGAAERWVVFWAGLHDLGKACPGFQFQLDNPKVRALLEERMRASGLPVGPAPWVPHGQVSAEALVDLMKGRFGLPHAVARGVATAVGGHHGSFPSDWDVQRLPMDGLGRRPWPEVRRRYAEWLAEAVGIPEGARPTALPHATAMAIAGFVSMVDWIGSSEEYFTHAARDAAVVPTLEIADYGAHSQRQALVALRDLGWTGWIPSAVSSDFASLFPGMVPRPLQSAVVALADELKGPAAVVIEAPMGEGKTEAAMYLADVWQATLGQRGIYFALPTQATSASMFERVRDFLEERYPHDVVNLQLLHGHAALSAVLEELRRRGRALLSPESIYDGDGHAQARSDGAVIAAEWFASGKRALLAPFGVGTVDQALLAALQVLHVFVRVYGLATKTVIVDEVHAYDTYMSTLLERLLEWLGALEVPVALLSATLPGEKRRKLLAAYARGAGWPEPAGTGDARYPRVAWVVADGAGSRRAAVTPGREETVHVGWIPEAPSAVDEEPPVAKLLERLLASGGCAAVICNTVGRAQQMFQALRPYFSGSADDGQPLLDLFHARFPFEERAKREGRALTRFGKKGPRPGRAVLVATQVIEQSLDLDFDVMVSDLAPADLVLQRVGRLHRHDRRRPDSLREPRVYVVASDEDVPGGPEFDRGSERVYAPHILLRSWLALRDRTTIAIPEDVEKLVEAVYGDVECPADSGPELRERWDMTLASMLADQERERLEAENRYIGPPFSRGSLAELAQLPREEDAPELHPAHQALTRLTELTVQVVCLGGTSERPTLRPGGPALDRRWLRERPTIEVTRDLLSRAVSLSDRRVVHALLKREVPKGWQDSPVLRRHRPLYFGEDRIAPVGDWLIRLDPELGLVIERA